LLAAAVRNATQILWQGGCRHFQAPRREFDQASN
jgi:hypothetical protein